MDKKSAQHLDILRNTATWRDPLPCIVTIADGKPMEYKTLSRVSPQLTKYAGKTIDSRGLSFDGAIIAHSVDITAHALMLGDIVANKDDVFEYLFIPMTDFDDSEYPEKVPSANYLADNMNVVFDERQNNTSVRFTTKPRSRWWHPSFDYVGTDVLPDNLAYVYCRNRLLEVMYAVWTDAFIIPPRIPVRGTKSIKTIARATTLANLLLLDRGNFDVFKKKGKCPAWQVAALKTLEVPPLALSEDMKKVFAEVSRVEDVASFWRAAADEYGWALRMSSLDLEDDRIDETKKRITKMAELIDLEMYLDTYEAGVPASDILA